jgi:hypothetical protein
MGALKILPLIIMLGGGVAMGTQGKSLYYKVVTKVKVLLTGMEVVKIGDEMRFHFLSNGTIPGDDESGVEFEDFLRENFKASYGSRDPSLDMWGNPYQLWETDELESGRIVISTGPNGEVDECVLLDGESVAFSPEDMEEIAAALEEIRDEQRQVLEAAQAGEFDPEAAEGEGEEGADGLGLEGAMADELPLIDDICVSMEFALRDTPYRAIPAEYQ